MCFILFLVMNHSPPPAPQDHLSWVVHHGECLLSDAALRMSSEWWTREDVIYLLSVVCKHETIALVPQCLWPWCVPWPATIGSLPDHILRPYTSMANFFQHFQSVGLYFKDIMMRTFPLHDKASLAASCALLIVPSQISEHLLKFDIFFWMTVRCRNTKFLSFTILPIL